MAGLRPSPSTVVLRGLLQLLAPARCASCDLELQAGEHAFCGGCAVLLDPVPPSLRPPATSAAVFTYAGPIAEAVRRLKYADRTDLAAPLGALLAEAATPYAGRVGAVVALPLHPERLRERGFNQSALLARPVARALGVGLATGVLRRVRPTVVQAALPRERRLDNVRGAFQARAERLRRPVLLVDDVRTTGATLAEAAAALLAGGAPRVYTLALARADG